MQHTYRSHFKKISSVFLNDASKKQDGSEHPKEKYLAFLSQFEELSRKWLTYIEDNKELRINYKVFAKEFPKAVGLNARQFKGEERIPAEQAASAAASFANIFISSTSKKTPKAWDELYEVAHDLWSNCNSIEDTRHSSNIKIGSSCRFLRLYKEKTLYHDFENKQTFSNIEQAKRSATAVTLTEFFKAISLNKEELDRVFDIFIKETPSFNKDPLKKTPGITKEEIIISKALYKADLEEGLKVIAQEGRDNFVGNTLKYLRLYKDKSIYDFKGLESPHISHIELGKSIATPEFLTKLFKGLNFNSEDFDKITNFINDNLNYYTKGSSEKKAINYKEDITLFKALYKNDFKAGLELITGESKTNFMGAALKFIRLHKKKSLYDFSTEGLDFRAVSAIELGKINASTKSLEKLFAGFGLNKKEFNSALSVISDNITQNTPGTKLIENNGAKQLSYDRHWVKFISNREFTPSLAMQDL